MSILGTFAIGLIFALVVFCAAKAQGKEPAPEFTGDVFVQAGVTTAEIGAMLQLTGTDATIEAIVKQEGVPTTNTVACSVASNGVVACDLTGLKPGTNYWVILVATNAGGETETPKKCFRTRNLFPTKEEIGTVLVIR